MGIGFSVFRTSVLKFVLFCLSAVEYYEVKLGSEVLDKAFFSVAVSSPSYHFEVFLLLVSSKGDMTG